MTDVESAKRKTVILLGAGASHGSEFNLPLMPNVLDRSSLQDDAYINLRRAMDVFSEPGDQIDLEDFLAHIDMTTETFLGRWNRTRRSEFSRVAESARRQLGNYLAWRLSHEEKPAADHMELFRRLGPQGTILTLNYDRIADCSLMEVDGMDT